MTENKSLMIITPKTYSGGAENVAARLSCFFAGFMNVQVVTFDASKIDYDYAGKLIDLELGDNKGALGKLSSIIQAAFRIKKIKKETKPTACISLIGHPNISNILSKNGELCVVSVRTYLRKSPFALKRIFQKLYIRFLYNKADKVVAICEGVKYDLINYYGIEEAKIDVIYPYFDTQEIQTLSCDELEDDVAEIFSHPVIITVGRMTYDKGHWHLIKAFKEIKQRQPEARLVILGRGELEDDLKLLAKSTGLEEHIHFLGYRSNPYKYIRAATVFAFPSLIEGFGNALGEAIACGTPVVAADCDVGPREIIAPKSDFTKKASENEIHECGILVPPFDEKLNLDGNDINANEEHLAAAIIDVLTNAEMREKMSEGAKVRAASFDIKSVTKQWRNLLELH
ncbi:glycosyltransferase [Vreelandella neptunia]|uniref:Glycosyltransferase n=1 Tax=Vreelandella neptunia TaxID=115551 RepID=A0ABS9S798_9GAMM|nr:glycosyltransferase [Halomonas neptunia]MCH4811970.1 glycosyltransferase [Halomonas neptunia]